MDVAVSCAAEITGCGIPHLFSMLNTIAGTRLSPASDAVRSCSVSAPALAPNPSVKAMVMTAVFRVTFAI
jgi:hypothetical protein